VRASARSAGITGDRVPGPGCGFAGAEPVGLGAGLEDAGVEGDPVDDGGNKPGVGEDGAPFAERQVGSDRDGGFLVAFGDDLEEQSSAAGVDLDVTELVDLCRHPHSWTYAGPATMPRGCVARL
jgi:hypothetical protein